MRLSAKECRSGVVATETALCMVFVWLPALAVLWLMIVGGAAHIRLTDGVVTTGILITQGKSESEALEAGRLVAGGEVAIVDGFIIAEKQINVFGKMIPVKATRAIP